MKQENEMNSLAEVTFTWAIECTVQNNMLKLIKLISPLAYHLFIYHVVIFQGLGLTSYERKLSSSEVWSLAGHLVSTLEISTIRTFCLLASVLIDQIHLEDEHRYS